MNNINNTNSKKNLKERITVKEKYNSSISEKIWQKFWEEEGVYHFNPNSSLPLFSIDTPPPTISGALHIGHIYSYTQAEIFARFQRMNNKNVRYPIGMDNNGLPTERLVEKELGIKPDKMNLDEFIKECEKVTKIYSQKYRDLWKSVGLSVDWRLEYSTISQETQKLSQKVFNELYEKKLIYKKNAPALYCCECQTAFAQAEKEDKEVNSKFYNILFKLEKNKDITIATTRPEFLPACVAVFVHPEDKRYKKLIGKEVKTPLNQKIFIRADEKVDKEKGTGAVMCCTYGDETDVYWVKKYNLPEKIILHKNGRFKKNDLIKSLEGKTVEQARKLIVDFLNQKKMIQKEIKITHNIDVHERCGAPVEYLPTTQWFVKLLDYKKELIEAGDKIKWHPEYMKKRYKEWVNGLKWDWCISRERFYGIPIPVFNCDTCSYIETIDESKLPINPKLTKKEKKCPKCEKGKMKPEKNVFDTWFTSSLTPDINNINKINGKLKNKLLPMSMRPHAHDIIRTWTVYTILISLYRHNNVPWKNLVISGFILLKKGQKISKKSGGGKFAPEDIIFQYSADAVRYAMSGASIGRDSYFDEEEIKKGKKLVTKIYNAGKFVLSNLIDYNPRTKIENLEIIDRWIILRSQEVGLKMSEYFNKYNYAHAKIEFEKFFWNEFCDNYLEMIKKRINTQDIKLKEKEIQRKKSAQFACYKTFLNIIKMISPYMPHIAEEMYHGKMIEKNKDSKSYISFFSSEKNDFFSINEKSKSVTTTKWPIIEEKMDTTIKESISLILDIISKVRKYRSENNMNFSLFIDKITISCKKENINIIKKVENDIKTAVKIDTIKYVNSQNDSLEIYY